jgi:hypothetical protein
MRDILPMFPSLYFYFLLVSIYMCSDRKMHTFYCNIIVIVNFMNVFRCGVFFLVATGT